MLLRFLSSLAGLFTLALVMMLLISPVGRGAGGNSPAAPGRRWSRASITSAATASCSARSALDLFAVLLGGAGMLPVYRPRDFLVGSEGLDHLRAAPAVEAMMIELFFSCARSSPRSARRCWPRSSCPAPRHRRFGPSAIRCRRRSPCLAVLGAADMFSVYVRQSLIQL